MKDKDIELIKRMKEVRETFHINQRELADRIGVTSQLISQIETGKIAISHLTAKAIEAEFGVSHDWLMYGDGEMLSQKKYATKHVVELSNELRAAITFYPNIATAMNKVASIMTLADWNALNDFVSRFVENKDGTEETSGND